MTIFLFCNCKKIMGQLVGKIKWSIQILFALLHVIILKSFIDGKKKNKILI